MVSGVFGAPNVRYRRAWCLGTSTKVELAPCDIFHRLFLPVITVCPGNLQERLVTLDGSPANVQLKYKVPLPELILL